MWRPCTAFISTTLGSRHLLYNSARTIPGGLFVPSLQFVCASDASRLALTYNSICQLEKSLRMYKHKQRTAMRASSATGTCLLTRPQATLSPICPALHASCIRRQVRAKDKTSLIVLQYCRISPSNSSGADLDRKCGDLKSSEGAREGSSGVTPLVVFTSRICLPSNGLSTLSCQLRAPSIP